MDVQEAFDAVFGTSRPKHLTAGEIHGILRSVQASGREDGFEEGYQAGVKKVTDRIRRTASLIEARDASTATRPDQRFVRFLYDLARTLETAGETEEARAEYEDPTTTIRRNLEEKQRLLRERENFEYKEYASGSLYDN